MNYTDQKETHTGTRKVWYLLIMPLLMVLVSGCGDVDSGDGVAVDSIALPSGVILTLYCPDAGIHTEKCILDDPNNPYRNSPVPDPVAGSSVLSKFDLAGQLDEATDQIAIFYVWATAQALSPRGEDQFYTAVALHRIHEASGSELSKTQALRAYRSVLDNYFDDVTVFEGPGFSFAQRLRDEVIKYLGATVPGGATAPFSFFNNADAKRQLKDWGYAYNENTGELTRNFSGS